jgi:hypothetical protein
MSGDPKTNEWNLLKDQFAALVRDESVGADKHRNDLGCSFSSPFRRPNKPSCGPQKQNGL